MIFELGYVEKIEKKPLVLKAFFDIFMSYSAFFYDESHEDY